MRTSKERPPTPIWLLPPPVPFQWVDSPAFSPTAYDDVEKDICLALLYSRCYLNLASEEEPAPSTPRRSERSEPLRVETPTPPQHDEESDLETQRLIEMIE